MLDKIIKDTGIKSSSLITEDGIVIATNSEQNDDDEEITTNFAAISASILSMAERGIEIINENKILEQIKIDTGINDDVEGDFSILISRVVSNVLLQVIYPQKINIGLVQFESNNVIRDIKEIIEKDTNRDLFKSLGSLT